MSRLRRFLTVSVASSAFFLFNCVNTDFYDWKDVQDAAVGGALDALESWTEDTLGAALSLIDLGDLLGTGDE